MAFTFDQIFAADPSDTQRVVSNGLVTIFTPGDASMTPIPLETVQGALLPNPVMVNEQGFGPAFIHQTLDRVAWSGGGLGGFLTSYEGIKNVALAAQAAAEDIARRAADGEFGGGGGGGGGGAPNNGNYWNRTQTAPVITIGANAPWPNDAPEGAVIIRLSGTGN